MSKRDVLLSGSAFNHLRDAEQFAVKTPVRITSDDVYYEPQHEDETEE